MKKGEKEQNIRRESKQVYRSQVLGLYDLRNGSHTPEEMYKEAEVKHEPVGT